MKENGIEATPEPQAGYLDVISPRILCKLAWKIGWGFGQADEEVV